jgi:hypothetical protein
VLTALQSHIKARVFVMLMKLLQLKKPKRNKA